MCFYHPSATPVRLREGNGQAEQVERVPYLTPQDRFTFLEQSEAHTPSAGGTVRGFGIKVQYNLVGAEQTEEAGGPNDPHAIKQFRRSHHSQQCELGASILALSRSWTRPGGRGDNLAV